MPVTVITAEQAMQVDPHQCAPPICTTDAHRSTVGRAHGRVLPLIGNTRPYLYDVTVVGTPQRIYADRLTDVLSVLVGDEYSTLVNELEGLDAVETGNGPGVVGYGDVLPQELADDADPAPEPEPDKEAIAVHQRAQILLYDLAVLRTRWAESIRVTLQQAINAEAVANGEWTELSDNEREELTLSATDEGGFPIGIPGRQPVLIDGDNGPQTVMMRRPEWRASTKLVINTGHYNPWTEAPFIETLRTARDDDGHEYEYPTAENAVMLSIDTEEELIDDLVDAGYLTVTEHPMFQPDRLYDALSDDPIATPYLRRDQPADRDDHADANQ